MSNRFSKYTSDKLRIDGWLDKEQATTLRTRLQQVESERDELKGEVEAWRKEVEGSASGATLTTIKNLISERDKVEADAAMMRRALEYCYLHNHYGPLDRHHERYNCVFCETVVNALATNAGKSLLLRLQEAEWLIEQIEVCNSSSWLQRRDAFLNPKPQDVK